MAKVLHIEGMQQLQETLGKVAPREGKRILNRTVTRIAAEMRKDARSRAPRRDGTLRKAIKSKRDRGSRDRVEASLRVTHGKNAKYDAFYWHFVEFGTAKQSPAPFITPAMENARARLKSNFHRHFFEQFQKEMQKRAKAGSAA